MLYPVLRALLLWCALLLTIRAQRKPVRESQTCATISLIACAPESCPAAQDFKCGSASLYVVHTTVTDARVLSTNSVPLSRTGPMEPGSSGGSDGSPGSASGTGTSNGTTTASPPDAPDTPASNDDPSNSGSQQGDWVGGGDDEPGTTEPAASATDDTRKTGVVETSLPSSPSGSAMCYSARDLVQRTAVVVTVAALGTPLGWTRSPNLAQDTAGIGSMFSTMSPSLTDGQVLVLSALPPELISAILDQMDAYDVIRMAATSRHIRYISARHDNFYFDCRLTVNLVDRASALGSLQLFTIRLSTLMKHRAPVSIELTVTGMANETAVMGGLNSVWDMRWRTALRAVSIALDISGNVVKFAVDVTMDVWSRDVQRLVRRPALKLRSLKIHVAEHGEAVLSSLPSRPTLSNTLFSGVAPKLRTVALQGVDMPEEPVDAFSRATMI
ncbi:hypothetical protein BKA62DRAFT_676875 [Auriculariales sp. MPI-PUGE-AT-0066]|nr:hypothetical protein BKA62DRAFT_676875 [Auriculariales sp. MPI-PUGE-AT-0066]